MPSRSLAAKQPGVDVAKPSAKAFVAYLAGAFEREAG